MPRQSTPWRALLAALAALGLCGCTLFSPIRGVPSRRLPPQLLAEPRTNKELLDLALLGQEKAEEYLLDADDVLGVYIEGILGTVDQPPPVHFPEDASIPPSIGFPTPVREDGTISLPFVIEQPVNVAGMTVIEAEAAIRKAYTQDKALLPEGKERIIVTLIRPRKYRVLVVREDAGPPDLGRVGRTGILGAVRRGTGEAIDLPAYENDVLHALTATGGLPGLDAKNEIQIRRRVFTTPDERSLKLEQIEQGADLHSADPSDENVTRIPLRYAPGEKPDFSQEDVILNTGDIVFIESRETDVFYTAGLLTGGQYQLARDYDLTVLDAISIAGAPIGAGSGLARAGFGGTSSQAATFGVPPSDLVVIRKMPDGSVIPIAINLTTAMINSSENILVKPGDTLLLRYTPLEELTNFALSLVRVNVLFNGLTSRGL